MSDEPGSRAGAWRVFGWSTYLACSWTWCIGMFLPVLLVRDYGLWGFVVFAVPNVIGAAAVGWIIKSPEHSRRLVETHAGAMRWFSYVTIAFHAFWLTTLGPVLLARLDLIPATNVPPAWAVSLIGGATILVALLPAMRVPAWRVAVGVFALSAGAILVYLWNDPYLPEMSDLRSGMHAFPGVIPIALSCILGFMLCPHLDATLHHAAQQSAGSRRLTFGFGFGALFLVLVLFTFEYSGHFIHGVGGCLGYAGELIPQYKWVLGAVALHMLVQAWFTTSRHVHVHRGRRGVIVAVLAGFAASGIAALLRDSSDPTNWANDEVIYRLFLSFYGLVFPAYVWVCMIPTRDGHAGVAAPRGRLKLRVTLAAIVLAAPMFWMGFIARHEIWLIPGLAVVLASRLLVRSPRTHPTNN